MMVNCCFRKLHWLPPCSTDITLFQFTSTSSLGSKSNLNQFTYLIILFCIITNAMAKPVAVASKLSRLKRQHNSFNRTKDNAAGQSYSVSLFKGKSLEHSVSAEDTAPAPSIDNLLKGREEIHKFQKQLQQQMLENGVIEESSLNEDRQQLASVTAVLSSSSNSDNNNIRSRSHDQRHKIRHSKHNSRRKHLMTNAHEAVDSNSANLNFERQPSNRRFFDVSSSSPYECPKVNGKVTQLLCPSRRRHGYHVCIDETALCNGRQECPNGEDENPVNCMFYKTTMRYFKTVVDQVVELSEHVLEQSRRRTLNDEL